MTRLSDTLEFTNTLLLQGRVMLGTRDREDAAEHVPALEGVAPREVQQRQALQPDVNAAVPVQQQPPRHRDDAQSKLEVQGSPGEYVRQAPEAGAQPEQPARMAEGEQQ